MRVAFCGGRLLAALPRRLMGPIVIALQSEYLDGLDRTLGKAAPVVRIVMFTSGNIDVEFLQPGPEKSAWRDLLEEKGPGCHHIAFRTKNLTERTRYLEDKGHRLLQRGEFDSDKEVQPKQA
ncbi:VOC family protein [Rhizobium leguminosarum]|uniref:VOC family protein n=1 Tax=Rhizobium leguminosarum TaxID=384 RepID=UPI001F45B34B|nr:VOC family protein [Rhizobium leguminosarum]